MASTNHLFDSRLNDFITRTPAFGDTVEQHLVHTVACFSFMPGGRTVLDLGVTWDELRDLANGGNVGRKAVLAAVADNADAKDSAFAIPATWGVYGDDTRTGLTWGDLRALVS